MDRKGGAARAEIPVGSLDLMLLKALTWGEMHGYGLAQRIQQGSDGVLIVEEGSLYPALQRLRKNGDVDAEWRLSDTGRRARYYALTQKGRERLTREIETYARVSKALRHLLAMDSI